MPFDRLVSHSLKVPEFTPYIPPPRPVVPWASYIVPAVDKIAQSMVYAFSPYERQMRGAELAKAQVGMKEAAYENRALDQMMNNPKAQSGGMYYVPGKGFVNPLDMEEKASAIQKNNAITNSANQRFQKESAEIGNAQSIHDEADRIRKAQQKQRSDNQALNDPSGDPDSTPAADNPDSYN